MEPVYDFTLTVPAENAGRVMHDIPLMAGTLEPPEMDGETASFKGRCPVATMQGYAADVAAYSRGKGRLSLRYGGYEECHNADEVIAASGYSPEADLENTPDSVFCSHGAGVTVGWREVEGHMHLPPYPLERDKEPATAPEVHAAHRADGLRRHPGGRQGTGTDFCPHLRGGEAAGFPPAERRPADGQGEALGGV